MSDRDLLEAGRAMRQTLDGLQRDMKQLQRRGWAGAVRSAHLDEFTAVDDDLQTVLNLEVTSGRWVVMHRGVCTVNASAAGFATNLISRTPAEEIVTTAFAAGWVLGFSRFPFCDVGDLVVNDITTISLQINGISFDSVAWTDLSLMAIPV